VVADHSKIGAVAKWLLCPTREVDLLITDNAVADEVLAPFKSLDIDIMLV
jgi:DeoR/GlpR family transcriptional regulator of sugar metabolism